MDTGEMRAAASAVQLQRSAAIDIGHLRVEAKSDCSRGALGWAAENEMRSDGQVRPTPTVEVRSVGEVEQVWRLLDPRRGSRRRIARIRPRGVVPQAALVMLCWCQCAARLQHASHIIDVCHALLLDWACGGESGGEGGWFEGALSHCAQPSCRDAVATCPALTSLAALPDTSPAAAGLLHPSLPTPPHASHALRIQPPPPPLISLPRSTPPQPRSLPWPRPLPPRA